MLNERAFIARLEAADVDEFGRMIARPSAEQEIALRRYLGDARFQHMHELAARAPTRGAARRGNVVVIHGIMGGELTSFDRDGDGDRVWLNFLRLIGGAFERLRLNDDGDAAADLRWDVRASGMYKPFYGEQLLHLSQEWNVRAFWYDWRMDLEKAAALLDAQIGVWFGAAPVHLVAHSMGGLVARAFIAAQPRRWAAMQDGGRGGRLLMLGTPNHGSFDVPQILVGLEATLKKLAAADLQHDLREIGRIVHTFPGVYQMLPSPFVAGELEPLYRAATYGEDLGVPQQHLDRARRFHERLRPVVDPGRMIYVAGYNQRTLCGIEGLRLRDQDAYHVTLAGDGRVAHAHGLLEGVPTYYVEEVHGSLPCNARVLEATTELLATGTTRLLPDVLPPLKRGLPAAGVQAEAERDVARIQASAERLRAVRGAEETAPISDDERVASSLLLRGWLGAGDAAGEAGAAAAAPARDAGATGQAPARPTRAGRDGRTRGRRKHPRRTLTVCVVHGGIENAALHAPADPPVDAVALGHYVGVRPQNAELELDRAISRHLAGLKDGADVPPGRLLLTQYTERGTIRGELGQIFLLPDPRDGSSLAIAGMGLPGRFGAPEATVLARELLWALSRLGRKHLASVLIGAGEGNLHVRDAVAALLHGVREAMAGGAESGGLRRLTLMELNPGRVVDIDRALRALLSPEDAHHASGLDIVHEPLDTDEEKLLLDLAAAEEMQAAEQRARARSQEAEPDGEPTRVTVTLERRAGRAVYRFGAITASASVPEREVVLDERLVTEANDLLPGLHTTQDQERQGRYLEQLLLSDLRPALVSTAPLVLVVDATTARIHWEMLAQPGVVGGSGGPTPSDGFLGTVRGLTRQLRTTFAPLPEPPPPPQRPLRALIVADPAADAPLPGAAREGFEIRDLFDRFASVYRGSARQVQATLLTGPNQASRNAVLNALFSESYDILHFAGHCFYDDGDPAASGWVFDDGTTLSAYELRRVDRVPKFVFSNACQSGITPDRCDRRNAALAPSFAEAFFQRGVANFVCTAWPIGDDAALTFALNLYAGLLGLGRPGDPRARTRRPPLEMQEAMKDARQEVRRLADDPTRADDVRFWGAYQHYGSPTFRFFYAHELEAGPAAGARKTKRRRTARAE